MWEKLKDWYGHFVQGRYGVDLLYYVLLCAALVLWGLGLLLVNLFLILAGLILMLYAFWRTLSRDLERRRAENAVLYRIVGRIRDGCRLLWNRVRYCRTSVFKRCPHCRAVSRFPRKKGDHRAVCPRCKTRYEVKVWWELPEKKDE